MNTNFAKKVVITASAATICLVGPWAVSATQAKTNLGGGGSAVSNTMEIDEIVTMRKVQFAHDYVAYAAARAEYAARGAATP
jgi:hypothetical protein